MIDFHPVETGDKQWIDSLLKRESRFGCEYTFGNIYSYSAVMEVQVAEICGCLAVRYFIDGLTAYCYPIGDGDREKALEEILRDGSSRESEFVLFALTAENAEEISRLYPGAFEVEALRQDYEYIYLSEDLIELKGRKYQPKRNHISFFCRSNRWQYEKIDRSNINECLAMSRRWLEKSAEEYREELEEEYRIIELFFAHYEELGLVGGLLRCDGEVIAYTFGEKMTEDMFCVHVEKAYADIRGAYAMINRQFVLNELSEYKYINREDDTGAPNLRKAKLSYHPAILYEKYEARPKKC